MPAVYKTWPGLYIHKTRPRPIFFSLKKVNKIRPYIFIHIFNLNDEYCNEFNLYNYYYLLEQKFIRSLLYRIVISCQYKNYILVNYFYFFYLYLIYTLFIQCRCFLFKSLSVAYSHTAWNHFLQVLQLATVSEISVSQVGHVHCSFLDFIVFLLHIVFYYIYLIFSICSISKSIIVNEVGRVLFTYFWQKKIGRGR